MTIATVAPFAGAWIEIVWTSIAQEDKPVAPFAGAWIEIWEAYHEKDIRTVAPFAGAWIEIIGGMSTPTQYWGRSLRGSVD